MPWEYIRDEVASGSPPAPFGDEAFAVDDTLYVRRGETVFWVDGKGIDDQLRNRVVEHILSKLDDRVKLMPTSSGSNRIAVT